MYEHSMEQIYGKTTDFKMCVKCKNPNWYENEECVNLDCTSTKFRKNGVKTWLKNDYKYYMSEGYTEEDVDKILIET